MNHPNEEIRFEELGSTRIFESTELQDRANHNSWDERRKQYLIWLGDHEAAFMTFDIFLPKELNLYELFVATEYRGHGVGTAAILFAADLGRRMGKAQLSIRARPLSEQSQDDLIAWYVRRGLTPTAEDPELLMLDL
jgi:GNAT superfamily N-acetyltransferase